jgi:hypothetical protein
LWRCFVDLRRRSANFRELSGFFQLVEHSLWPIRKNLVLRDADGYSPGRTKSAWSFRQEDARRPAITVLIGGLPTNR